MEGGAAGLAAAELVELGLVSGFLSHVEKKSSEGSLFGVDEPSGVSSKPSMWIPLGFLWSARIKKQWETSEIQHKKGSSRRKG